MDLKCPFLHSGDDQKLLTVLNNYFSLGQYEFARATLQQLYKSDPRVAKALLQALVYRGAPSHWLCSQSVPSAAHLSWLSITQFRELVQPQQSAPQQADGSGSACPLSAFSPKSAPPAAGTGSLPHSAQTPTASAPPADEPFPDWLRSITEFEVLLSGWMCGNAAGLSFLLPSSLPPPPTFQRQQFRRGAWRWWRRQQQQQHAFQPRRSRLHPLARTAGHARRRLRPQPSSP